MAALAGCSSRTITRRLPEPDWPSASSGEIPTSKKPEIAAVPSRFSNVQSRLGWAKGGPNYANMKPMTTPRWVTVHHDAMDVFTATSLSAARSRLELIRTVHRRDNGWGDIGYHYAIDPAGRIHACRPVQWQGAHVKYCNPGNIGIVVLGDFSKQRPTKTQLAALKTHVTQVRSVYKIPRSRVRGHKDWPSASTACPGKYLHSQLPTI